MLTQLSIQNIVLIETLDLDLGSGLTTLTGETGAGKSILLDSIGLVLGNRAETRLIRHGSDKASVTASFVLPSHHPVFEILTESDIEPPEDNTLLIRRSMTTNGQNKIFLNDQPVSASFLKKLGTSLGDIHGQFDTHSLMNEKNHLKMVDQFGHLSTESQKTAKAWYVWQETETKLKETQEKAQQAQQEEDYLRHVLKELEAVKPQAGEDEELEKQRIVIRQNTQSSEALALATQLLGDDDGADMKLGQAIRTLEKIVDLNPETLTPIVESLARSSTELSDALFALQDYQNSLGASDYNLDQIEERLLDLKDLARKHRCLPGELLQKMEDIRDQITLIENLDAHLAELKAKAKEQKEAYITVARALSKKRHQVAKKIDHGVMNELPPMKMEKAIFQTDITEKEQNHWGADGIDHVSFLVTTNPGSAPGPLNKIASGGELSRIMLALKLILSTTDPVLTLVFDEVDSGIGGATAHAVGERLSRLAGEGKQVLVVTHSPQVAAKGKTHWKIMKQTQNEETTTHVETLPSDAHLEEIARMLAGADITEEAKQAAQQLLSEEFAPSAKAVNA